MLSDLNPTTTPEPTTLRSLQPYASHQTELIESLLDPSSPNHHFRDCNDEYWVQFWLSVWDKDPDSLDETEKVEGDPDPIDGSPILSDVVPSNRDVMNQTEAMRCCWHFECKKIFIRSEHREAEEFALSVCGDAAKYDGLVIAGQPGIGKSVFLLRTLLRRLALKLPTALQIRPNHALLFCRGGVKEFSRLENRSVYHPLKSEHGPPGRIWVLVDSNRELHEPAPAFQEGFFFVVEASSPRPSRHEWIRGIRSMSFYMKSWSFMEVLQARSLIQPVANENKLSHLHHTYGASLKSLLLYADRPRVCDNLITKEVDRLSRREITTILEDATNVTDSSHYLISTEPLPNDRTSPERKVTSKLVLEKIRARALREQVWRKKNTWHVAK